MGTAGRLLACRPRWQSRVRFGDDRLAKRRTNGTSQDAYEQTRYILHRVAKALEEVGASLADVTRTRMFVTDINEWPDIGRAHGEFFGDILPAATMVQVAALINPDHRVEIEVDAVISS